MEAILWWGALALTGLIVGVLSGLFGVGGGFLLTPLLTTVFGLPESVAVGTGVSQMVGTGLAGFLRYRRLGYGNTRVAWALIGGALMGTSAGVMLLDWLALQGTVPLNGHAIPLVRVVLTGIFVVLLSSIAIFMHRDTSPLPPISPSLSPTRRFPLANLPIALWGYFGFVIGMLSGLLGIGGGVFLIPLLIYGFGLAPTHATASSTLVLLASALMSTFSHALRGNVQLPLTMTLLIGSTMGAQWGALRASKAPPQQLRRQFATLVLVVCLTVLRVLLIRVLESDKAV
jgi:uncharacterized protein